MIDPVFRFTTIFAFVLLLCLLFITREHDRATINARLQAHAEWIATQESSLADLQGITPQPCNINVLVVQPKREP